jgi:hypothetical protein
MGNMSHCRREMLVAQFLLVRMVNDFPSGEYTIEAGFILKENRQDKYPEFYRQTFAFKK